MNVTLQWYAFFCNFDNSINKKKHNFFLYQITCNFCKIQKTLFPYVEFLYSTLTAVKCQEKSIFFIFMYFGFQTLKCIIIHKFILYERKKAVDMYSNCCLALIEVYFFCRILP